MEESPRSVRSDELLAQMGWVRALARGLLSDPGLADDVAQDAWILATERPPREREGSGLKSWLASVARTLARQSVRSSERRTAREKLAARPEAVSTDPSVVERGAMQERVVRAVMELEEPYRSTILHRYLDGLSAAEIARRQGVAPAAVRQRLARAIDKLRRRMDADFAGDRDAWSLVLLPFATSFSRTGALMAKTTAIGWVYVAAGAIVLGAITFTISERAPQNHLVDPDVVSSPREPSAKDRRAPTSTEPAPPPPEERSALSSSPPVPPGRPSEPIHDETASRLDAIVATFRTDRPEFEALHVALGDLARVAIVDPGSLRADPTTGHPTGRFTIPGSTVTASFDIDTSADDRSSVSGTVRFEWGSREDLGPNVIGRDVLLQLRGMAGGRIQGATSIQFHPDTRRKPSDVLGTADEIVVGWIASYGDRGSHLVPITARPGSETGSWQIGTNGSVSAVDEPGSLPPSAHDDWYHRIEPYAR
jgi:RNA polymerase sigma factor (sigma-70 family)